MRFLVGEALDMDLTDFINRLYAMLPSLAIICEYLPWTLTITPTPHAQWQAPYVTVGDVLHALVLVHREELHGS